METQAEYVTVTTAPAIRTWNCLGCGRVLGLVQRNSDHLAELTRIDERGRDMGSSYVQMKVRCQYCDAVREFRPSTDAITKIIETHHHVLDLTRQLKAMVDIR